MRPQLERRSGQRLALRARRLLAAIDPEARNQFENDAKVEYPVNRIGRIHTPFEQLLPWIATSDPTA